MRIGIFDLIDPPPGQEEKIRAALNACDYPWARIIPALRNDLEQRVLVKWGDTGQNASGLWYVHTYEIWLSNKPYHLDDDTGFVFLHECGHMVDDATFTIDTRNTMRGILHTYLPQIGHFNHDHPDAGLVNENWKSSANSYVSRLNEAYADAFVWAFAPEVWSGSTGAPDSVAHSTRFVHWAESPSAVIDATLEREIMAFSDVPENNPHKDNIDWAAENGIILGRGDGTFNPDGALTRAAMATILKRYDDFRFQQD
jgi:hypothetical protein